MTTPYSAFTIDGITDLTCCQRACPVETDVSGYLALMAQGRMEEALAVVREVNPFPGTCGRVCDHQCEDKCRRVESDAPVAIRALKRFLVDYESSTGVRWPEPVPATQTAKVAVIGSGPAGLTAAADLVRRGYPVTVFEALPMAGGMMRVGIPDYRLPAEALDFDVAYLTSLGVAIRTHSALGRDFTLSDLADQGFAAVVLATGAHGSRLLAAPGADLPGVQGGIDFLRSVKLDEPVALGQRVVVIGGGDVAMDTARTAVRLGATAVHVVCLETREQMPAHAWEALEALDEQIIFHCGWGPKAFTGDGRVQQAHFVACTRIFDEAGKFAPAFDDTQPLTLDADNVLIAIGQYAVFAHAEEDGIEVTPARLYHADADTLQTTAGWVFAAGDAVTGTATVVKAIASGHRAAAAVAEYLAGEPLTGCWAPVTRLERPTRGEIAPDFETHAMAAEPELPAVERVASFAEVRLGLTEAQAIAEAARCMRCDAETKSAMYNRFNREQIYQLARDTRGDEAATLAGLKQKLAFASRRKWAEHSATLDDLVFLPANLTRLVIDPYREPCATTATIAPWADTPLRLDAPVVLGGLMFETLHAEKIAVLCQAAAAAGIAVRLPVALAGLALGAPIIAVCPLALPADLPPVSAVEIDPAGNLDVGALRRAKAAYRLLAPSAPVGLSLTPWLVAAGIEAALEAGLDFVSISAMPDWDDAAGIPDIAMITLAMEILRAKNREEDVDLLYFGGVRSGTDAARCIALGAKAAIIGNAARIAAGFELYPDATPTRWAALLANFVTAMRMEAAVLARCCGKTDVMNLEPEDLRSLTVETSRATGVPLVGSDVNHRLLARA